MRQLFAALALDLADQRRIPGFRVAARVGDALVERAQALGVVGHAAGRVQIDGLERAHEGPAPAQAVAHRLVHVFAGGHAFLHQRPGFAQQHGLQPVQHKAFDFLAHMHHALPHGLHQRVGKGHGGG
ncbi:hypothetical protein D3C71_1899300 [compost metagenome]